MLTTCASFVTSLLLLAAVFFAPSAMVASAGSTPVIVSIPLRVDAADVLFDIPISMGTEEIAAAATAFCETHQISDGHECGIALSRVAEERVRKARAEVATTTTEEL